MRRSVSPFIPGKCFFCQKGNNKDSLGKLHEVSSKNRGAKLKQAVDILQSEELLVWLSATVDPTDARAIDAKYHKYCLTKNVDHASSPFGEGDFEKINLGDLASELENKINLIETLLEIDLMFTIAETTECYRKIVPNIV